MPFKSSLNNTLFSFHRRMEIGYGVWLDRYGHLLPLRQRLNALGNVGVEHIHCEIALTKKVCPAFDTFHHSLRKCAVAPGGILELYFFETPLISTCLIPPAIRSGSSFSDFSQAKTFFSRKLTKRQHKGIFPKKYLSFLRQCSGGGFLQGMKIGCGKDCKSLQKSRRVNYYKTHRLYIYTAFGAFLASLRFSVHYC